jgi:hypothetical protein
MLRDEIRFLELRVRHERADAQAARAHVDAGEIAQSGDVDEELGPGEPHVERGNEALAAGEDPRARPFDQLERLGERFRLGIGE